MNKNLPLAALFATIIIAFSGSNAFAQQAGDFQLINIDQSAKVQDAEHSNVQYLNIDTQALDSGALTSGSKFWVEINPGQSIEMKVTKVKEYYPGIFSYTAKVPGENNKQFVFTYSENRLNGIFHESHDSAVYFNWDAESQKNFLSDTPIEGEQDFACEVLHDDGSSFSFINQASAAKSSYQKSGSNTINPAAPLTAVDDSITIDLLVLYTDAAETWTQTSQYGNINNLLAQAMAQGQAALDNSDTGVELRVVHTYKTDYDDDDSNTSASDHLRRLTQSPENPDFGESYNGYMEEVHGLRDEYGADLVVAIMSEPNTGGIAWRLTRTNGSSTRGFSVNRVEQGSALGLTIVHEIGHNMGNAHSRTQASNESTDAGGLFHYSAGYQDFTNGFATVMAYSQGAQGGQPGVGRVPIFSSPDLSWEGIPTGTSNIRTPQNSARSIREIKRTIASYRPTIDGAPIALASTDMLEINMNREDELEVTFDISNTGESALVWDVDFDFPDNLVGKVRTPNKAEHIKPIQGIKNAKTPANYSGLLESSRKKAVSGEEILYETSFEGADGFSSGSFDGLAEWRVLSGSEFAISNSNARSGSQHLRLESGGDGVQFISSPFFSYQIFGSYEFSVDFSITGPSVNSEYFDFYVYDGKSGEFSSGVIITDNTIYTAGLNESGGQSFYGSGTTINPDVYYTLRIVMDAEEKLVKYYINGQEIGANEYLGGYTAGIVQVLHRNNTTGSHIDVDNIEIKKLSSPYNWLSISEEDLGGVTASGESSPVSMTFNTEGMAAGTYETKMTIKTNSPDQPLIEIPVTLEVNQEVSNEPSTNPDDFTLSQNYPNPFNPTTNIRYSLESAQEVELTIFNMQGQKVTTLQNGVQQAGSHTVTFNGENLASGVYMYQLKAGSKSMTRQMVLIK